MADFITRTFTGYSFVYAGFENGELASKTVFIPIKDHAKALKKAKAFGSILDEAGTFVNESRRITVEDFYNLSEPVPENTPVASTDQAPADGTQGENTNGEDNAAPEAHAAAEGAESAGDPGDSPAPENASEEPTAPSGEPETSPDIEGDSPAVNSTAFSGDL